VVINGVRLPKLVNVMAANQEAVPLPDGRRVDAHPPDFTEEETIALTMVLNYAFAVNFFDGSRSADVAHQGIARSLALYNSSFPYRSGNSVLVKKKNLKTMLTVSSQHLQAIAGIDTCARTAVIFLHISVTGTLSLLLSLSACVCACACVRVFPVGAQSMLAHLSQATGIDPILDCDGEGSVNEESLKSYLSVTTLSGKWVLLKYLYAIQDFRAAGRGKGGQGSALSAAVSQARAEKPNPKRATSSASGEGRKRGRPATNPKTLQKQRAKAALAAALHDDPSSHSEGEGVARNFVSTCKLR
jgi:hypothetical protein